LFST